MNLKIIRIPIRKLMSGQASAEYLIIFFLVTVLLITGNPSPIEEFFDAVKNQYSRFTYAMSAP
jgi:Flp pilus assembly pilin Flp